MHSSKDCIKTYENARKAGLANINADLIFDIPGQTIERGEQDLKTLMFTEKEIIQERKLAVEISLAQLLDWKATLLKNAQLLNNKVY